MVEVCRRLGARSQKSFGSETMARIAGYCFVAVILASIGATVANFMPLPWAGRGPPA